MYNFHFKTLLLKKKTNKQQLDEQMWLHPFWKVFWCLACLYCYSNRSKKSFTSALARFFSLFSHWKQWITTLFSVEYCHSVNAALESFQKYIQSTKLFFLCSSLICSLPPSTLLIHQPTTSFCLAVTLLVALEQSRGGTFEVGQVAAGNIQSHSCRLEACDESKSIRTPWLTLGQQGSVEEERRRNG